MSREPFCCAMLRFAALYADLCFACCGFASLRRAVRSRRPPNIGPARPPPTASPRTTTPRATACRNAACDRVPQRRVRPRAATPRATACRNGGRHGAATRRALHATTVRAAVGRSSLSGGGVARRTLVMPKAVKPKASRGPLRSEAAQGRSASSRRINVCLCRRAPQPGRLPRRTSPPRLCRGELGVTICSTPRLGPDGDRQGRAGGRGLALATSDPGDSAHPDSLSGNSAVHPALTGRGAGPLRGLVSGSGPERTPIDRWAP